MAIVRKGEGAPLAHRTREWDPFQSFRDLMNWDPFRELVPRQWRGGEERLAFIPDFDVRETKDAYVIKGDLPGFRDDDIEINLTANRLTVSGKREEEHEEESGTQYVSERAFGSFTRSFTLPEGVNADQVTADFKSGVLSIHIPKSPETQPKRIELRGGESEQKKVKA
jgi:HSP20 family protein